MQVQLMDIKQLVPYERNAKKHPDEQIKKIASSIQQFGWDQPIVVDEYNVIIKGHGRYFAAESLGLEQVPVYIRSDLTDEQKRAARLADNRTAESDWDWDLVSQELAELRELDMDMELTGFEEEEIEGLLEGGKDLTEHERTEAYSEPREMIKISASIPQHLYEDYFKQLIEKLAEHPECTFSVGGGVK